MSWRKCIGAVVLCCATVCARGALPTPDHVVVVIEENHSEAEIIGKSSAPYINSLASGGADFTNFTAIGHPSQPNYLELFSGSAQGTSSDTIPSGTPFSTANLGAALTTAGKSFAGYSEGLPSAGSLATTSGEYARKHNPWSDWQDSKIPLPANHLAPSVNQPVTAFPTDFTKLPTVSIVVPNLLDDMHDGTIAAGDSWLKNNLDAYNTWAKTHNSLLIVSWDEDDSSDANKIPVIFSGPMVRKGDVDSSAWNHYSLLRTIEDMYGATRSGSAATASDITAVFVVPEPTSIVLLIAGAPLLLRRRRR
jgi:phosphatidylinositol-3-phosphatase